MNAAYLFRLVCLSLASFFLVNGIVGAATALFSSAVVRVAEKMRPRSAARFLFAVRMLPSILGLSVVLGLCVPSYLWLEPQIESEHVGLACLLLAGFAATVCSRSLVRTARAISTSARLRKEWQHAANEGSLTEKESQAVRDEKALVVQKKEPLLVLSGILRPRMVISQGVITELSKEQLGVAVRHEMAHRDSRDNLKRLLLVLSPKFVPFANRFIALEKTWARFSEWAADDEAVQGDSQRALSLATALLRVARMGARPQLSVLHTCLLPEDDHLAARVDRLLRLESFPVENAPHAPSRAMFRGICLAACILMLAGVPAILSSVHRLLELFLS
ncbi:MAG TPA: M56 family metallopeptidase [Candidatus Acidoferrum sp.]|nr:M56 family metallopeptidase [Candidatus Acidoferrum sp.]